MATIGVFDSGLGGVSALIALKRVLPNEKFVYYADNKNAPYGLKSNAQIVKHSLDIVDFLIKKEAKAIVVACNTATSAAVDTLRFRYNLPIIGMEPALKPALALGGKTVILGTSTTLRNRKLRELIDSLGTNKNLILLDGTRLVSFVERLDLYSNDFKNVLHDILEYHLEADNIVLGCTHFPFFKDQIYDLMPHATIVDGHMGTAKRLKSILEEKNLIENNGGSIEFFSSKSDEEAKISRRLYELNLSMEFF